VYNPAITEKGEPENEIRIFTKGKIGEKEANQGRILRKHEKTGKEWKMYTDRSCIDPNTPKAKAGIGIYCKEDNGKKQGAKTAWESANKPESQTNGNTNSVERNT